LNPSEKKPATDIQVEVAPRELHGKLQYSVAFMGIHGAVNISSSNGVSYNCGDCGSEVVLRPGDVVICRECGYRILYKKRTKQGTLVLTCTVL